MSRSGYYRHFSKYSDKTIQCPQCKIQLTLKEYENQHAFQCRQLKLKETCIFCTSGKRWTARSKDFKHIIPCLEKFMKEQSPREDDDDDDDDEVPMEVEETPVPCVECKKFRSVPCDMFGRQKDDRSEYIYDSLLERPEDYWKSDIQFSKESGLGSDIYGIVQKFLKRDMIWYHLIVVLENFDNFVKAMEKMKDQMFLLPFWCLCEGRSMRGRVHRHMIIAVEPGAPFQQLWTTQLKNNFGDRSKSKYCIRINDAFHLIRTIQYVSQRKSSCDDEVENTFGCSPFHIIRPLHEHAIVCMSTMFEGGMETLLKEQLRNKDVVKWLKHIQKKPDRNRHLKYAVPIGKAEFKFITCVLPLASHFEPTDEKTDVYLTWLGSKKMYLRINPSLTNLSRESWYTHQAAKGNIVWSIHDEWYMLSPKQQNAMNQIKAAVEEATKIERNRSEEKFRQIKEKQAKELAELEEKNAKELAELEEKNANELAEFEANLTMELETAKAQHVKELASLENDVLKLMLKQNETDVKFVMEQIIKKVLEMEKEY